MSAPRAVLVGPPGAGKTTVGTLLAERLAVAFRDTDADVESLAGKSVPEIFYDDGEPVFRSLEEQAVATALAEHTGVLSLGGGAVLSEANRAALSGHHVVWLKVGLSDAASRTGLSGNRPVLALNPRATLRALLEERRPLYEAVASVSIDTDARAPHEVVEDVLACLPPRVEP